MFLIWNDACRDSRPIKFRRIKMDKKIKKKDREIARNYFVMFLIGFISALFIEKVFPI